MAGFEHGVGRRGLWGLPALAVTLGLSASAAHAGSPTLPGATAFGDAFSCFNAPCLTNQYDPQYAQAETSIYGVPLSTFGDAGSYALETVRAPGPVYTVTYPNTPGAVIADPPGSVGTGSVTVNRTHPAMVVDIDRDIPGGGAQGDTGQVNYWFEVVNSADPDTRSPVTLGVTAAGGFFGSTTADIVYPDYFGDNASA